MKIWTMEIINNKNLQIEYNLPEKTFAVSYSFPYILVCSAKSRIHVIDIRDIQNLIIPH